ncbi:hypothetical protein BKA61DRAFT_619099 [Leptodontidium sp. MPI-SDFR-AT-0119]|nr:hypothetical protein BKA61DRAFT_619099 [Leptodontidium sp. MPI-SDFR-AT-0119]
MLLILFLFLDLLWSLVDNDNLWSGNVLTDTFEILIAQTRSRYLAFLRSGDLITTRNLLLLVKLILVQRFNLGSELLLRI